MRPGLGLLRTLGQERARRAATPRFMTYIVTFSCNARCIMCDSWKKDSPDDLTLPEIERIFGGLPQMDALRLSGGEPFVRRDLLDIAHLAQEKLRPYFLHVTTNGFLTDRIVRFCEERRRDVPLWLLISVDGVGEKHNEVRGHPKAWDYVMRTIRELSPRRKELRLQIAVNQTVVDAEGARHYLELRNLLRPYGVRNNMVMAYDASATYSLEREIELAPKELGEFLTFGDFGRREIGRLLEDVESGLRDEPYFVRLAKRYYLDGLRHRLLEGRGEPNPPCVALSSHLRLLPNGDVPVCQFNSRTVGNLRRQSFEEVWWGEEIEPKRDWVRACPGCWAECEVLPNAVYTGDIWKAAWPWRRRKAARRPAEPVRPALPVLGD